MLVRIANHIKEIRLANSKSGNKYKVLRQALDSGINVQFDVLYCSPLLLDEEIIEDIGAAEGRYIRELKPVLNYQIPKADDWRKYNINKQARFIKLGDIVNEDSKDK